MGLKTTNYVSKSTGLVLPEAYAVLKTLVVESDSRVKATFSVQASRENAQNFQPIDKVVVNFVWDRKTNVSRMAYEEAKSQVYVETMEGGSEVVKYGTLYGWQDDIV